MFYRLQGVCGAEVCNHSEDPLDCWALVEQDTVGRWNTADQEQNHLDYCPLTSHVFSTSVSGGLMLS